MSHASAFFRSHLMQQFAATARNQSRPPLALTAAISSSSSNNTNGHSSLTSSPSPSEQQSSQQQQKEQTSQRSTLPSRSPSSSLMTSSSPLIQSLNNNNPSSPLASPMDLPSSIQRAILHGISSTLSSLHLKHHHSRSSSFCSFKRLLTPSDATERLASIRYHVALASITSSSNVAAAAAARRRDRWRRIPAFLVALARGQPDQVETTMGEYELLTTRPPVSERQLEDYAATCAVVQSILHSLHLDGIASRWTTTDNVLKTRAFRDLIRAKRDELIVGLLIIGGETTTSTRRKRSVWGEEEENTLMQDI